MKSLEFLSRSLLISHDEAISVIEHSPHLSEESVHTVNTLCVPWLRLLERAEEHLIKSQSISTICVADHIWILNGALLVLAFLSLGRSFGVKTIYVIGLSSLLFAVLPKFNGELFSLNLEVLMDNKLMVALVGAFMESVGIGLVLLRGGSTGGTDIVAMIINKYWPISPGKVYLYSDIFIVSSLLFIPETLGGGVENMIYAFVVMVGFSFGVDYVLLGDKSSVQLLVFSSKYQQIADHIQLRLCKHRRLGIIKQLSGNIFRIIAVKQTNALQALNAQQATHVAQQGARFVIKSGFFLYIYTVYHF